MLINNLTFIAFLQIECVVKKKIHYFSSFVSVPFFCLFVAWSSRAQLLFGNVMQLRQKIASATSAIKSVFGQEQNQPDSVSFFVMFASRQHTFSI